MQHIFSGSSLIVTVVMLAGIAIFVYWHFFAKKKQALKNQEKVTGLKTEALPKSVQDAMPATQQTTAIRKYPAMAFTHEGIKFPFIDKRIGNVHYLEPSMPHHGAHYMVVEANEQYFPYDPREQKLVHEETPRKAYRAIKWDVVSRIFAYRFGLWDKINTVLIGIFIVGGFVAFIILISNIAGKK